MTTDAARSLPAPLPADRLRRRRALLSRLLAPPSNPLSEYVEAIALLVVATVVGWFSPLNYESLGHIYLLAVIALSLRVGRGPVLLAAVLCGVAWNFFFIPPRLSFSVLNFDDALLLGTYFAAAVIGGQLTARIRAQERRVESERLHRTLLDSVSHELKTPLAILRSATERLDTDDAARRAGLRQEIRGATRRLEDLVANLLNQTRLESGTLKPQSDWCDVRDIIATARRSVGDQLAGHAVTVSIASDMPLFQADAVLMEQVLVNLLSNAARHTPPASEVRISAGIEEGARRVYLRVFDNGPGLPPEIEASPFSKFRRGASAGPGGVGLGLSIVRGFVEAQGGEIEVGRGPGACFIIRLPLTAHGSLPADDR